MTDISTKNVGMTKAQVEAAIEAGRKAVTTWSKRRPIELVTGTRKAWVEATGVEEPDVHFGGACAVELAEKRKDEKAFVYVDTSGYETDDEKLVAFTHQLTHALTGATTGHNYTWRRQHVRVLVAVGYSLGRERKELLKLADTVARGNAGEYYNHWDREEDEEIQWLQDEAVAAYERLAGKDEDDAVVEKLLEEASK